MDGLWIQQKNRRRKAEYHLCEFCNKNFLRIATGDKRAKYCSKECSNSSKVRSAEFECWTCKEKFTRPRSSYKSSKSKVYFCSRGCKHKAQRIEGGCKDIQPNHYKDGGATKIKSLIRDMKSPCCIDCGISKSYLLDVHHVDSNRKNNPVDGSNWEILCANCHKKRHLKIKNGEWIFHTASLTPRDKLKEL